MKLFALLSLHNKVGVDPFHSFVFLEMSILKVFSVSKGVLNLNIKKN